MKLLYLLLSPLFYTTTSALPQVQLPAPTALPSYGEPVTINISDPRTLIAARGEPITIAIPDPRTRFLTARAVTVEVPDPRTFSTSFTVPLVATYTNAVDNAAKENSGGKPITIVVPDPRTQTLKVREAQVPSGVVGKPITVVVPDPRTLITLTRREAEAQITELPKEGEPIVVEIPDPRPDSDE